MEKVIHRGAPLLKKMTTRNEGTTRNVIVCLKKKIEFNAKWITKTKMYI